MKHSPTPWIIDEVRTSVGRALRIGTGEMLKAGKGCCIIYDDYPGHPDNERSANARHIVHCVNVHGQLVEALEQVEREMRAGFGSSFGETREQVRRALSASRPTLQGDEP